MDQAPARGDLLTPAIFFPAGEEDGFVVRL
jgi:hypothetical protein